MASRPRIRAARPSEVEGVWDAIVAEDLNPQRDGTWFGAFDADTMVGALHLVRVGGDMLLDDVWVRSDRRREGIGGHLVHHAQRNHDELWLIADPDGVTFYERHGFAKASVLPPAIASRYASLGLWPGHLGHLHVPMRWTKRP